MSDFRRVLALMASSESLAMFVLILSAAALALSSVRCIVHVFVSILYYIVLILCDGLIAYSREKRDLYQNRRYRRMEKKEEVLR